MLLLCEGLTDGERVWLVDGVIDEVGIGGVILGVSDGVWLGERLKLNEGVTDGDVLGV